MVNDIQSINIMNIVTVNMLTVKWQPAWAILQVNIHFSLSYQLWSMSQLIMKQISIGVIDCFWKLQIPFPTPSTINPIKASDNSNFAKANNNTPTILRWRNTGNGEYQLHLAHACRKLETYVSIPSFQFCGNTYKMMFLYILQSTLGCE